MENTPGVVPMEAQPRSDFGKLEFPDVRSVPQDVERTGTLMAKKQNPEERKVLYAASLMEASDDLKSLISGAHGEGWTWEEIAKCVKLPAYCVRVIAGDIRRNRVLPEYENHPGR